MVLGMAVISTRTHNKKLVSKNEMSSLRFRSFGCTDVTRAPRTHASQSRNRISQEIDARAFSLWKLGIVKEIGDHAGVRLEFIAARSGNLECVDHAFLSLRP